MVNIICSDNTRHFIIVQIQAAFFYCFSSDRKRLAIGNWPLAIKESSRQLAAGRF